MSETQNPAVGGPVDAPVRPRAWAIFVDNGNARMWSTLQPHVQKLAGAEGLTITPLYDQAALDAFMEAVTLLRECERTLEMWADVAPAVSLRADIRKLLARVA